MSKSYYKLHVFNLEAILNGILGGFFTTIFFYITGICILYKTCNQLKSKLEKCMRSFKGLGKF